MALAILLAAPFAARAAEAKNPYLPAAERLYHDLEYEEALRTIERAATWPSSTPQDDVRIALFEGLINAGLGRDARAIRAFKRALAIDPKAVLPVDVPPKIEALFATAHKGLRPAPPPAPPADEGPTQAAPPAPGPEAEPPPPPPAPARPDAELPPPDERRPSSEPPTPGPEPGAEPDAEPEEPDARRAGAPGTELLVGADVLFDALGKSVGLAPGFGVNLHGLDLRLSGLVGSEWGLALDAGWAFVRSSAVSPRIGVRATAFPGLGGFGGGIGGGVRVRLGAGLSLNAQVSY